MSFESSIFASMGLPELRALNWIYASFLFDKFLQNHHTKRRQEGQ
jgi:hypothetical protein